MTTEQHQLIARLAKCSFLPGSFEKRFIRDLSQKTPDYELGSKQAVYLEAMAHRYRKQLKSKGAA